MKGMAGRVWTTRCPSATKAAGVVVGAGCLAGRAGAAGQDGRHARRRDVHAVPLRSRPCTVPGAAARARRRPRAPPASSTRSPRSAWSRPCAREGHKALVHTAAASNLGQMLNRICLEDGVAAGEHRAQGRAGRRSCARGSAPGTCATRARPTFMEDLTEALVATGATLAFDAIGGGKLAGQILTAMEAALNRTRQGIQPLRLHHAQAGLHLRRPRPRADRVHPQLRHGLGHGRLAAHAVPAEDRRRGRAEAQASASPPRSRRPSPAATPRRSRCRGAEAGGDRRLLPSRRPARST